MGYSPLLSIAIESIFHELLLHSESESRSTSQQYFLRTRPISYSSALTSQFILLVSLHLGTWLGMRLGKITHISTAHTLSKTQHVSYTHQQMNNRGHSLECQSERHSRHATHKLRSEHHWPHRDHMDRSSVKILLIHFSVYSRSECCNTTHRYARDDRQRRTQSTQLCNPSK